MNNKNKVRIPEYMKNFKCITSECEDNCCCNPWNISVDKETYSKYKQIEDKNIREKLLQNILIISEENLFAIIKHDSNKCCPFLTKNKMCNLQLMLGEDYLSQTCALYPRKFNLIGGVLEQSASMSCPEAARKALLNYGKMKFIETNKFDIKRKLPVTILNPEDSVNQQLPQKYFLELRESIINVLQDRRLELWERVLAVGILCNKIDKYNKENNNVKILSLLESVDEIISKSNIRLRNTFIDTSLINKVQIEILLSILLKRRKFGTSFCKMYIKCFNDFISGLQILSANDINMICQNYINAYNNYYKPFIKEHGYIIENYLVNYVFMNLFPFSFGKELYDSYIMLVIHYTLIKMILIGIAAKQKCLSKEDAVNVVYSFSRTIEHNREYLKYIFNFVKEKGVTSLPQMYLLLKNE